MSEKTQSWDAESVARALPLQLCRVRLDEPGSVRQHERPSVATLRVNVDSPGERAERHVCAAFEVVT